MIPDALYDLALEFKKNKLWMELLDSQLFAVRHADGALGYCCVTGEMGEHIALAVYPGEAGLDAYRKLLSNHAAQDEFEVRENALAQDCVMLSFQNKSNLGKRELAEATAYLSARGITPRGRKFYPQFERFEPCHMPWRLEAEADKTRLREALEAALEVSAKLAGATPDSLGFAQSLPFDTSIPLLEKVNGAFEWKTLALDSGREPEYPSPDITDDISIAKLNRCKKGGGEWACDIFMHWSPVADEDLDDCEIEDLESAPYFPYLMLVVDYETGMVIGVELAKDRDYSTELCRGLVNVALKNGIPDKILVSNPRARAFFKKLAPRLGAKLSQRKSIPVLIEAKRGFAEKFGNRDEETTDIIATLSSPALYDNMPDDLLMNLRQAIQLGALPENIVRLVERECRKRGL